jgi:hypothetical protein
MEFMHADIPAGVALPECGVFASVEVHNDHPLNPVGGWPITDASIPTYVTCRMDDGTVIALWPNGICQVAPNEASTGYLVQLTPNGILPAPRVTTNDID